MGAKEDELIDNLVVAAGEKVLSAERGAPKSGKELKDAADDLRKYITELEFKISRHERTIDYLYQNSDAADAEYEEKECEVHSLERKIATIREAIEDAQYIDNTWEEGQTVKADLLACCDAEPEEDED
jgi:chromosome segregation ATPase